MLENRYEKEGFLKQLKTYFVKNIFSDGHAKAFLFSFFFVIKNKFAYNNNFILATSRAHYFVQPAIKC